MLNVENEVQENKKSVIAAHSFFMGSVNFLVISYPNRWQIHSGDFPPEIERYTVKNEYAWVTKGMVKHYFTSNDGKFVGLEVNIKRKKSKNKFKVVEKYDEGEIYVNGHKASYFVGKIERGLILREDLESLVISYYCDMTDRYIAILFYSKDIRDVYREFLYALSDTICH